jgi:hypothetical protein
MPLLLAGDHPTNAVLRAQYARSRIRKVELTGVGFFVEFEIPSDVARTVPTSFAGGSATIEVEGVKNPAGSVLFVKDGMLSKLEGYTYGWDAWPEYAAVIDVRDAVPIGPPAKIDPPQSSR